MKCTSQVRGKYTRFGNWSSSNSSQLDEAGSRLFTTYCATMKEYLFSYGTLQKNKVQLALFGRILQGYTDTLPGYKTVSIEIKDEAFLAKGEEKFQQNLVISHDTNDAVKGTVFELTREELLHADKYEPDNYKRIKVDLQSGKKAWIYSAVICC